jgi:AtzE family amidohydrolase
VPSSLNGIFGIKPTYGRLSRRGTFPFVHSLDHVGPFARNVADLTAAYEALQGLDAHDPAQAKKSVKPVSMCLAKGAGDLRIALAGGYFIDNAGPDARSAVKLVAEALDIRREVILPEAERARAAAFVITATEGSQLHLTNLQTRPYDFEPLIRDRFIANAMTPAAWYAQAQRFRRWFYGEVMKLFVDTDIIICAATPVSATPIGAETFDLNGLQVPSRPSMGLLTQPISFIGLPVVTVPVFQAGKMPLGVQVIAAPWHEAEALRVAAELERLGVVKSPIAQP